MKTRAIFILCTFIILFAVNKISLHNDIKKQNEDIAIVNVSGKQRMYSQKITKLALIFKESTSQNSTRNTIKLKEVSSNFTKAHQNLANNHLKKYDDFFLNNLFEELEPNYLRIVTNTNLLLQNKDDKNLVNKYVSEIKLGTDGFLPIMDSIVNQYEIIGKNRGKVILSREFTFNIIIAILSIYSVFFLIFPLINSRKESIS